MPTFLSSAVHHTTLSSLQTWILLTIVVIFLIGMLSAIWRMFIKAGRPGWAAIIPFYSSWVLAEVAGLPGWLGLATIFLAVIPSIGWICAMIVVGIIDLRLARRFDKSTVYGIVVVWILSPIGYVLLGYGNARYIQEDKDMSYGSPNDEDQE